MIHNSLHGLTKLPLGMNALPMITLYFGISQKMTVEEFVDYVINFSSVAHLKSTQKEVENYCEERKDGINLTFKFQTGKKFRIITKPVLFHTPLYPNRCTNCAFSNIKPVGFGWHINKHFIFLRNYNYNILN